MNLELELIKGTNLEYRRIRAGHYVADNGSVGRQLRYLIHYGKVAGIIAGGMSALSGKTRDAFFGLDIAKRFDEYFSEQASGIRIAIRNLTIINNTVFRLTHHEHGLASRVLALWRKQINEDWAMYNNDIDSIALPILGFETYIVAHDHGDGRRRDGACYRFDGWTHVGKTATGKLLYCRKNEDFASLYSGECLLNYQVVELFQAMFGEPTVGVVPKP